MICFAFIMLLACSKDEPVGRTFVPLTTLTHKAYFYYGMSEYNHRSIMKGILGVDPVTTEWCAAFVNMVLLEHDYPQSSTVSKFPLLARSFMTLGSTVTEPEQGDIVIFPRGNSEWQGHVGFYVSTVVMDGVKYYNVLGGNQNNQVGIDKYPAVVALSIRRMEKSTEAHNDDRPVYSNSSCIHCLQINQESNWPRR